MSNDLQQLVLETIDQIGVEAPAMIAPDAPTFDATTQSLYLVGLIGGKDVGKSSIVNALVGQPITAPSSFGEGTARAIAYAHEDSLDELRSLLRRALGVEQIEIVSHRVDSLRRQVLLDLPDIDSHWAGHVQLVRKILRWMLFPVWVQSVEKYADAQPRELLKQVAAGNDPANFIFCLNKADQLSERDAREIRDDFGKRLAAALKLPQPPDVYLISAKNVSAFDLPELRETLSKSRSAGVVEQSVELADRRKQQSLLDWLEAQNLSERAARAQRLASSAQESIAERIASPVLEDTIARITSDSGYRLGLTDAAMNRRLSRWPIVNVINTSLSPLMMLVRKNLSSAAGTREQLAARGRTVNSLVQTTFAQLRQIDPSIAMRYHNRRLWEDAPADFAAVELSQRINSTIDRQRDEAVRRIGGGGAIELVAAPIRWLLTIGALLWFPLMQPILERILNGSIAPSLHDIASLIVPLLGASYLLHCAAFLIIYFFALWMILRWDTQRRVNRLIARWSTSGSEFSLANQVLEWSDDLVEPLSSDARSADELAKKFDAHRSIAAAR